jgi:hypothetical protein
MITPFAKAVLVGLIVLIVLLATARADQAEFEAGWELGFKTGYQSVHGQYVLVPLTPMAPLAPFGQDDFANGFKFGLFKGMGE